MLERLCFRQHHSGQRETSWKNVPTFRLYKWRSATITHTWTLHFKSEAAAQSRAIRASSLFVACGCGCGDHQTNAAPAPMQSKVAFDSLLGHHSATGWPMVQTFKSRGGGVTVGPPSGPAAQRAGVEHLQENRPPWGPSQSIIKWIDHQFVSKNLLAGIIPHFYGENGSECVSRMTILEE